MLKANPKEDSAANLTNHRGISSTVVSYNLQTTHHKRRENAPKTYAGTVSMGEREDADAAPREPWGVDSGLGDSCSSDGAAKE